MLPVDDETVLIEGTTYAAIGWRAAYTLAGKSASDPQSGANDGSAHVSMQERDAGDDPRIISADNNATMHDHGREKRSPGAWSVEKTVTNADSYHVFAFRIYCPGVTLSSDEITA